MLKKANASFDIGDTVAIVEQAWEDEQNFAVPISAHYFFTNRSFNDCHEKQSLAHLVFGKDFTIKDMFLFGKLTSEGKVSTSANGSRGLERDVAVSQQNPFGVFADDFFTTLLAPTEVRFDAEIQEFIFDVSFLYKMQSVKREWLYGVLGFTIPFKARLQQLDLELVGGALRAGSDQTYQNFLQQFSSIKDYFIRGLLESKGLTYESRQRRTSIGDVGLFGFVDIAGLSNYLDSMQFGLNFILPSGGRPDPNIVWDLVLGNGGAFQAELFVNALFATELNYFNPTVRVSGQFSSKIDLKQRVPKEKEQLQERVLLSTVDDLIIPVSCDGCFIDQFKEFDTAVLQLADQAVPTTTDFGSRVLLGLGNYWYNVFNLGFRFGLLYQFMYKSKDSISIKKDDQKGDISGTFNTSLLELRTQEHAHTLSWSLTYKFYNFLELNMGSQHVVAGKNVPCNHEIFASLVAVF